MYTLGVLMVFSRSGITRCSHTSFDNRLSERKKPSGSEKSVLSFQNSWSVSCDGSVSVAARRPENASRLTQRTEIAASQTERRVSMVTSLKSRNRADQVA